MKPNQDLGESREPRISYTKFTLPFLSDTDSETEPDEAGYPGSKGGLEGRGPHLDSVWSQYFLRDPVLRSTQGSNVP